MLAIVFAIAFFASTISAICGVGGASSLSRDGRRGCRRRGDHQLPVRMHREDNIGHFAMSVSTALLLDVVYACIFNQDYFANY